LATVGFTLIITSLRVKGPRAVRGRRRRRRAPAIVVVVVVVAR